MSTATPTAVVTGRPATVKQLKFLRRLLSERALTDQTLDKAAEVLTADRPGFDATSSLIDLLLALPKATKA